MSTTTLGRGTRPYKALVQELKDLRGQSGVTAYRRAEILVALFEDMDYRHDARCLDDDICISLLDEFVEDLCMGFENLRALLKAYPKITDGYWKTGQLEKMFEEIPKAKSIRTVRTRESVTIAEHKTLKEQNTRFQTRLSEIKIQLKSATERIETLKEENKRLKAELKAANTRIHQLEAELTRLQRKAA